MVTSEGASNQRNAELRKPVSQFTDNSITRLDSALGPALAKNRKFRNLPLTANGPNDVANLSDARMAVDIFVVHLFRRFSDGREGSHEVGFLEKRDELLANLQLLPKASPHFQSALECPIRRRGVLSSHTHQPLKMLTNGRLTRPPSFMTW